MSTNYEWFLSNGECLRGKDAYEYMMDKFNIYEHLIERVEETLLDCLSLNRISDDEFLADKVLFTGESLSLISILLESLLDEISMTLSTD